MNVATLTLQDVLELPLERREFLGGELFVPPAPEPVHQSIIGKFFFEIEFYLRRNNLAGRVFFAPLDVVIAGETTQPDFIFVAADQEIVQDKRIEGAPKWLVEVVSPTSHKRDFETKKLYYLENGVEEYWVISLEGRVIWVFTTDNFEGKVFGNGKLSPRCLPELQLELAKLF